MGQNGIKKKNRTANEGVSGFLVSSFFGVCASSVAAIILWFAASLAAYSCDDPNSLIPILSLVAVYLASAVGGFVSAKVNGKSGALVGAVSGIMFVLILLLISVFLRGSYSSQSGALTALVLRGASILASAFGGLVGSYKKPKRRRVRR